MEPENPEYVFTNETLIIPVTFLAKPMPDFEDITWEIQDGDFGHIMHPGDVSEIYTQSIIP